MPLIFSYGTLQDDDVQRSTFGREVNGHRDALPHYERVPVTIDGEQYWDVKERDGSRVDGVVLEITDQELAKCDAYEAQYAYERVAVTLASGKTAWVYLRH